MCYSKQVSAITYGIGSISSGLLFKIAGDRNDGTLKVVALFFLFVIQMQLIDFILWSTGPKCSTVNVITSNVGSILNHTQPIILYALLRYFKQEGYTKHKQLIDTVIILYILAVIVYTLTNMPISKCTDKSPGGYMRWHWNLGVNSGMLYSVYLIALVVFFYYGIKPPYNNVISAAVVISFLYSSMIFRRTWVIGSMWCWIAALVPVVLVIKELCI